MVLVLTPVDDPRARATKTSAESLPMLTDHRVSQIRFICRIVRGLSETWDPLDEGGGGGWSEQKVRQNRRILAKNIEVYRRLVRLERKSERDAVDRLIIRDNTYR